MDVSVAELGKEYTIKAVQTDDEELNAFLFSLGCYEGEKITVLSRLSSSCIVAIKDAKYNVDKALAKAIVLQENV